MKRIYAFTLNKEIEVEKKEKSLDTDNKEITILKKVKENQVNNYFIAKPTRLQLETAEIFFASVVSKCISQGILSVSLLQKRVLNDGGILSEEQKKAYEGLYSQLFEKQSIHKELLAKTEKTEEDNEKIKSVFNEVVNTLTDIQDIEGKMGNNLFQNTAENIARNRCSVFWMLNLAYKDENGKEIPLFPGKTYEEKIAVYDNFEENGTEYDIEVLKKFFLVTSLWYLGKAETKEEFDVMIKMSENQGIIDTLSKAPEAIKTDEQQELKLESK